LTSPAAAFFDDRFASSTASITAACAGILDKYRIW